jgi:hypothetical protein
MTAVCTESCEHQTAVSIKSCVRQAECMALEPMAWRQVQSASMNSMNAERRDGDSGSKKSQGG